MTDNDYRDELHRVIRLVRNRYRLRMLLTGAVIFLVGAFVLLVFSAILLEQLKFGPTAVIATRIGFYLVLGGVLLRYLVLPLARRHSDTEIALYIETHEPSLQAALLSAVQYDAATAGDAPGLVRRLLRQAVERAREVEDGRRIERRPLRWLPAALAGSVLLLVLAVLLGPPFIRSALGVLLNPWGRAEAAAPYAVLVEPGNTVVARGGDLRITASLRGFESDQVLLNVRVVDSAGRTGGQADSRAATSDWETTSMGEGAAPGTHAAQLFDLEKPAEYFVEANGIRSPIFRLDVRDLPYAKQIDLEYRFPAYTGLPAQRIQDGGDIAALRGTRVTIQVTPTMASAGGELVIEGQPPIPLVVGDSGRLTGSFTIQGNGFYHIELLGQDSTQVRGSLDYAIESLGDRPPLVEIVRPGRDTRVTSLEEVFIEARGEDDFGVARLELVYSVNGGPEKIVELHGQGARRLKEISAGHTLYLEEYELEPGDIVSYYARASDANPFGGPGSGATDIYFLQVRPFDREYREAEQAGMPGGQQGDSPEGLSEQQREIVSATYKANRDRQTTPPAVLRENLATISLAQGRLRSQVETLSRRMLQRGVSGSDSTFAKVAAELPLAIQAMREAENQLGQREPDDALPPEQVALQHLQRAEAAYREVQVSQGGQPGGGGGGSQSSAEDLADLFELENDRRQNQYETVQRGQEEQQRQELDEVMERLKQLASRQQQENERMLREAERMQQSGGATGGSGSQRRLAQEVDSLTRRLERLSRERPSSELQQSLRQLQEAADAMRRSASQPSQSGGQGTRALDRIEEARRLLEQGNQTRIRENIQQSAERARRLAQEQREVAQQAAALKPNDAAGRRRLEQAKDRMAGEVQDLENDLERAARDARSDQREAARGVQQAVNGLRESRVREKIEYSKGLLGSPQASRQFEESITANLDELGQQLSEAAEAVGESQGERTERSLDRARALAQGLESLAERARQQQGEQPGQQPGQEGEPGQQGQQPGQQPGQQQGQGQPGGQANGVPRQGAIPEGSQSEPAGDAQPGAPGSRMRGSDPRQLGRELRERRLDAERLRRDLEQEGVDVGELDRILGRLRSLEGRGLGSDRQALDLLQSQVIEGLKEFEFALRRQLGGDENRRPRSGRQGEVPPEYRELVDRYFQNLAE
jgi:hypothetical protein